MHVIYILHVKQIYCRITGYVVAIKEVFYDNTININPYVLNFVERTKTYIYILYRLHCYNCLSKILNLSVWSGTHFNNIDQPLIPAWSSDYIYHNVWDNIDYKFPNVDSATVEVWERSSNITHFTGQGVTYPCWGLNRLDRTSTVSSGMVNVSFIMKKKNLQHSVRDI